MLEVAEQVVRKKYAIERCLKNGYSVEIKLNSDGSMKIYKVEKKKV